MTAAVNTFSRRDSDNRMANPLLTIFSVLKPFEGEADIHQRNALASWHALGGDVEVILFSDSFIPYEIQKRFRCLPCIALNEFGTPVLSDVFRVAADKGQGIVRAFVNADILLNQRILDATEQLLASDLDSWLAVGQRTELEVPESIHDDDGLRVHECFEESERNGTLASIVCKDYFIFTGDLFQDIPAFAIGRGNWDNWMVSHAKASGVGVVDITDAAPVIHQKHGYGHVSGGRMSVYVRGPEARENAKLAGGRNLISGSTANWKLDNRGLRKTPLASLLFCKDLFRFAGLLFRMVLGRD